MSAEVSGPARASVGSILNPRANEAGEQISAEQLMDWVLRGYVFSYGLLVDDGTNVPSVTTLADTTPIVSLQSPTGGDTIVVPLRVHMGLVAEDSGGLTQFDIAYTKAAKDCATTLVLTGTTATGVINHLSRSPALSANSTVLSTVTASALTVLDSIVIAHKEINAAILTAATFAVDPVLNYDFIDHPMALMEGAALLLYAYTASTACEVRPSITWAEIPASIYQP